MPEMFKIKLTLVEGQHRRKETIFVRKGDVLLEAIQKKLGKDIELRVDAKYGLEVVRAGSLSKSEKEGVHFWINDKVPYTMEDKKKLYLSLYHIKVNRNMNLRLELVSISCEFENSVVDPRLNLRIDASECGLERLSFKNEGSDYKVGLVLPSFVQPSAPFALPVPADHFRIYLLHNMRNFGAWKRRPREPQFPELAEKPAVPALRSVGEVADGGPQPFGILPLQEPIFSGFTVLPYEGRQANSGFECMERHGSKDGLDAEKKYLGGTPGKSNSASSQAGSGRSGALEHGNFMGLEGEKGKEQMKPVPLSALRDFKAAIFDLDGVVVDSEKAHMRTFNRVFSEFGVEVPPSFWKRNYTGVGSRAVMEDVFRRNGISAPVPEAVARRNGIYQSYVRQHGLPVIPGFIRTLEEVRACGIRAAVASGSHRATIGVSLNSIGVQGMQFVGHENVKRHKPAPDTFLLAAEKLGAKPSECIVFEDSLSGIQAAASAGMACVALSTTLPVSQLRSKAALVVKDFNSPKLRKLLSRLIAKRKRRKKGARAAAIPLSGSKKRRGKKLRRPVPIRLE